jgi:hypothetical protein
VTLLLFLVSLAVMECLVRKPRQKPHHTPKPTGNPGAGTENPAPVATSMPGLLALGQALEAQGKGEASGTEKVPQVHSPPVDGV